MAGSHIELRIDTPLLDSDNMQPTKETLPCRVDIVGKVIGTKDANPGNDAVSSKDASQE